MNWYKRYLMAEKVQPKDKKFSWVFVDVPKEIMKVHSSVAKKIDKDDLYIEEAEKKGDWSYGIETEPHITLKWKLDFDDPQSVIDILKGEKGGTVEISDVEVFENDEHDVLVARVKSAALNKLHKKLTKELEIPDTHPEYKPHITVAYLKKGKAKQYVSMADKAFTYYPLEFDFDEVTFGDTKDKNTVIKLV
jgi:2'-5' RNA ligase